jgi:tetratricopeptide (TPR) repeat protein
MAWHTLLRGCATWRPATAALALLLCVGQLGIARAAQAPRDAKQEAKALFVSGQSHYNLNEFPLALRDFKEAYRLYPDPVFLYNLGQCERQLGHPDEAIRFYRTYLREEPKAPNRQEVLKKIEEMEAALKEKPPEEDKGTAPPPAGATPGAARPLSPAVAPAGAVAPVVPPQPASPTDSAPAEPQAAATPAPSPLPATPPVTPEPAAGSPDQIDLTASPTPPAESTSTPVYKRWWFWTAAAAVAVGAGVGIYAATSNQSPSVPASILGSRKVF